MPPLIHPAPTLEEYYTKRTSAQILILVFPHAKLIESCIWHLEEYLCRKRTVSFLHLKLGMPQPARRLISILVLCFVKSWKGVKFGTLKVCSKVQFRTQHLKENATIFAHWIEQSGEYEGLQAFTL